MSSFSKDSRSITWHQWHVEYPTERKTGLSSRAAFANASSPHGYQSTGLCACCKRYGLFSAARRFCISGSECSRRRFRGLNARATSQAISKPVRTSDLKQHSSNMQSYRRNLPHWYPDGTAVFVTWRLYGTLPCGKRPPDPSDGGAFPKWDRELDRACFGPACLKQPEVATSGQQIIHAVETARSSCRITSTRCSHRTWIYGRSPNGLKEPLSAEPTKYCIARARPSGKLNLSTIGHGAGWNSSTSSTTWRSTR